MRASHGSTFKVAHRVQAALIFRFYEGHTTSRPAENHWTRRPVKAADRESQQENRVIRRA